MTANDAASHIHSPFIDFHRKEFAMKALKSSLASAASGLALFLASPLMAETPVSDIQATESAPAGPALWKLSDEDTTIYLFGTIHILPKDKVWMTAVVDQALDSADMLVTEIPMDAAAEAAGQQVVMSKAKLPTGTTLRSLMTPEQTATYEAAMTKLGLPVNAFDQYDPWFAAVNFSLLPLMKEGYSPDQGVEKVLGNEVGADKPRGALETLEFQLSVFDELPQAAQVEYLIDSAEMIDEMKPYLDSMVAEWIEGDADALAALMNEGMGDNTELADRLLYNRNANWAVWIDDRMDQPGTVFIAVGAGHLAGERSVQDQLAQRGFTVTRVQ